MRGGGFLHTLKQYLVILVWVNFLFLVMPLISYFSASVTQEFTKPKTIKICWTWSCFWFFIGPLLYLFWNLWFILLNLIEVSLTFGTKLLLPLILKQCNSAKFVTFILFFLQGIGNFHSWPLFQGTSPPPELEPRTVQRIPTALSQPPHTYLTIKRSRFLRLIHCYLV